ncbi:MAG: amino acid dehydrogenase [Gammaproteobacteria bacterium]|nr:amino acid dehydrogenase [Gammaproteobacteria bacterium]MDH5239275.1 amino acid dehydrogenase [Gammaproteobacteria bacterium]
MSVFSHAEFDDHESLHFINDASTGLRAIIAIHSTVLGPAAGGCRRWSYLSDAEAVTDALRLSRGMTYKNAVAELPFGGGKAVILSSNTAPKSPQLLAAFGRAVDSLGGKYVTAEDVGMSVDDMRQVQQHTKFVSGLPQSGANAGGDPSPWTALGVYLGIAAAVKSRLEKDSLKDLKIAIQGVGHVGAHLCQLLHDAGAKLLVADVNRDNLNAVKTAIPVEVVAPANILYADVDVLAPCALGNVLTSATIPKIKAKVIAGAANNQLSTLADGARLAARKILYAPDYVINAGGIISVSHEYYGASSEDQVRADVEKIPHRLQSIFAESSESGRPTNELADEYARRLIAAGRK